MRNRNIAIVDLETTGLDEQLHEIIEVGMVVVNQKTLEIIDTLDMKVRPTHPETASAKALEVNGYNEEDWIDSRPITMGTLSLTSDSNWAKELFRRFNASRWFS